ncbi:hypothetical protein MA9V2_131 [Chryseobacterium phage MA9V-2]|nr:hypothetical protein MA9V2_131 [Chryseobacterium phage MA9V-2]
MRQLSSWIAKTLSFRNAKRLERSFSEHIIVFSNNGFVGKTQIQYKDVNRHDFGVALLDTEILKATGAINESALEYDGVMKYFRYEPQRQLFYVKFYDNKIQDHVTMQYTLSYVLRKSFIRHNHLLEYLANYKSFDYKKVIDEFDVNLG